ncbi:hypothetical protein OSB04_022333 [Centaurea solstitialis]|uniref:Bidirectional sugar transporter SWEET n=1 Tax=Centaurea solstitialis TaxID=347529 RepID=A0AA38T7Y6_9ASTR|nr:hypothetical protein OSB04_022333 [Centaurea solstitialis]
MNPEYLVDFMSKRVSELFVVKKNIADVVLFFRKCHFYHFVLVNVPTFYKIWKKKSVEQFSPVPYLVTFVNCGLWVFYGLPFVHPHSLLVTTTNGAGIIIFLGALFTLVLTLAHGTKLRSAIIGSICIAGNISMYASPLSVMKMVIKTKSVEYMPFLLSLFCFANGVCWFSYGLIRFDPFVVVPNGIGALFALAQLILYAMFYKSTQRILAERRAKNELSLGTVAPSNGQLESV